MRRIRKSKDGVDYHFDVERDRQIEFITKKIQFFALIISKMLLKLIRKAFLTSVTRFGEILPLWQHFQRLLRIYLALIKILNLLKQIVYAIGDIFIVVNDQNLNK